ncbi:RNA polymerase sigma factor [Sphingobacterium faecale]|uniref:Sigma-70 family RNA polymerase sigma factor n=1 Tax=Sphingobacterium faecale TaxID=2803775 RepID=A0ABS1R2M0_9SPHI|nr:sigma-70 family RNA polymerase sigma factor [Sphingobacterium faecale]MBL1408903.1 sigma-70 family RNA polymerase sigma factor [Sphingobacterium faecale]
MNQVVVDFQAGNPEAYQHIFHLFYRPLCLFLSKMGLNSFVTEEIVHDTFLKLWNKSADFSEINSLRSFLYVSCKNAALNLLDKEKRLRIKEEGYQHSQDWVDFPVTQQIIYMETIQEIHQAIGTLPDQCQKVIQLLFIEGYTPQEVADELGISSSTVYNQKMRGVQLLRNVLNKDQLFVFTLLFADILYSSVK